MLNNKKDLSLAREKQRFSIRKLSIGAASVLLGLTFVFGTQTSTAHAATATTNKTAVVEKTPAAGEKTAAETAQPVESQKTETPAQTQTVEPVKNDVASANKNVSAETPAAKTAADLAKKDSAKNDLNVAKAAALTEEKAAAAPKAEAAEPVNDTTFDLSNARVQHDNNKTTYTFENADGTFSFSGEENSNHDLLINKYNNTASQAPTRNGELVLPNTQDFIDAGVVSEGNKVYITPDAIHNALDIDSHFDHATKVSISNKGTGADSKLYLLPDDNSDNKVFENTDITAQPYNKDGQNNDVSLAETNGVSSIDLSHLDVSNVKDFGNFFSGVGPDVTNIDISGWDTSRATDMGGMFTNNSALNTIKGLGDLNTSNVTDMDAMFRYDSHLQTPNLTKWDTSKVTSMWHMFDQCSGFRGTLDLSNFDTKNVTNMESMFEACFASTQESEGIQNNKIIFSSKFDTSNVTNMTQMFASAQVSSLDLSSFKTGKVTRMFGMFQNLNKYFLQPDAYISLDLSNFDTRNVEDTGEMFSGAHLRVIDLSGPNCNFDKAINNVQAYSNGVFDMFSHDDLSNQYLLVLTNDDSAKLKTDENHTDLASRPLFSIPAEYQSALPSDFATINHQFASPEAAKAFIQDELNKIAAKIKAPAGEHISPDWTGSDEYMLNGKGTGVYMHYTPNFDKNQTTNVTDSQKVTRTIHYVYENGTTAAPDAVQTVTFTRNGVRDEYTHKTTWGAWTPTTGQFAAIASPQISGYVASSATVAAQNVQLGAADSEVTVTYTPAPVIPVNPQQPDKPDAPDQPSDPSKPTAPSQPAQPAKPAQPAEPATPDKPERPAISREVKAARPAAVKVVKAVSVKAVKPEAKAAKASLPQTGSNDALAVLGLLATSLAAIIGLAGKRKEQ